MPAIYRADGPTPQEQAGKVRGGIVLSSAEQAGRPSQPLMVSMLAIFFMVILRWPRIGAYQSHRLESRSL
jgi:hypothetical protein